ncbi:hypothetical protein FHW36_10467 [Chitinophaga polysaccharea]|uniref:Beta/gamma crystallin n=1 Tax=Chitinophaga polysaccharea TaxID=1293035 RepID=A0A561PQH8_9BACT|nr:hypothetical protein [Chitinophaga polysaccharea]TWF40385.1 hypothetical protein FHW36_10467 [Chitinophaga polysaccharea]
MKHLLIALICTLIGFSSSASNSTPKKTLPFVNKQVELKTISKENKNEIIVSSTQSNTETGLLRIQRQFLFEDACGNMWIIYVSGPSSATYSQMYGVAQHDFVAGADSNGCFHGL